MKQKQLIGILIVLVPIAAFVWLWNFHEKPVTVDAGPSMKEDPIVQVDNPQIRIDLIERARKAEYKSFGRNPFSPIQAPVKRVTPQTKHHEFVGPIDQPAPPPPPPPTLPLRFYGFGTVPNGTSRRAFLQDTNGDTVYVVAEGEVVLKRYRILRIGNASLEFEEISSGRIGTAPLVEEQAGGPSQ
ncbi:MAG TPA: hypothetical protein VI431_13045 [Candidatus Acidoferrum sp.]